MAIELEATAPGGVPQRLNRQNAQARQERWLAQLQDALFAGGGAHAPGQQGGKAPQQGTQGRHQAQRGELEEQAENPASGRKSGQAATRHADGSGTPAAGLPMDGGPAGAAPGGHAAVAGTAAAGARPGTADAAAPLAGVAAAPLPGRAAARAAIGFAAGALALDGNSAAEQPQGAAEAQPEPGQPAAAPQEDYAPRLLRLAPQGQGMQAWLRDASLQPGQVAAVAAALAGELAAQGQPLAALSINGKRLPEGALRAASDHARRHAFNAYTAAAQLPPVHNGKG